MASTLLSLRAARGDIGSALPSFTTALGTGVALSLVGKAFSTTDAGSITGAGVGAGVGLTVSASVIGNALYVAALLKFGSGGLALRGICDDIGTAFVAEAALATLTSAHAPVFAGTGTLVAGSITATSSSIAGLLTPTGQGLGMLGSGWADFSDAVGQGVAAGLAVATGSVVIAGSGGTPVPGAGVGSGTIS